ncbi:MAG: Rid family hydrolase, partial [Desulfobacterales bacterium]|nr:Rid family hydrolase [Desulfobacterales bacterium]
WSTGLVSEKRAPAAYDQVADLMGKYKEHLEARGLSLPAHCIRTWIFVRDVDNNYQGVVAARRELFETLNMTKDTHFIASTGIEGRHADARVKVVMDAYGVGGIGREQVTYLKAPQMLGPPCQYGVNFERGTRVDYGDRRHIFISGTASIDKHGDIVHAGDVMGQAERALANIRALLADAGAAMEDVRYMLIYLRDLGDSGQVARYFGVRYPEIPNAIFLAPVCRPEWLVEIECFAIKRVNNEAFPDF